MAGELFLDLDSSSDDDSIQDIPHGSVLHRSASQGGTTEGDNIDNIYPFAWALDGRRIGENSDASARPTSPNGAMVSVCVCLCVCICVCVCVCLGVYIEDAIYYG